MSNGTQQSSKRSHYSRSELMDMPREDLVDKVLKQFNHIEYLTSRQQTQEFVAEMDRLKDSVERQKTQIHEGVQRESILVMRLTDKEQQIQELTTQLQEAKQRCLPGSAAQLQSRFLEPCVNLIIERMKKELDEKKSKIEQLENDLLAAKFTPDSHIGKRLMAKCKQLHSENEELGIVISSGRVTQLENEIATQKKLIEQLRISERSAEEFLASVDDDEEVMQMTIYTQQSELQRLRERIDRLQEEGSRYRAQLTDHGIRPWTAGRPEADERWRSAQRDNPRKRRMSVDRSTSRRSRERFDSADADRRGQRRSRGRSMEKRRSAERRRSADRGRSMDKRRSIERGRSADRRRSGDRGRSADKKRSAERYRDSTAKRRREDSSDRYNSDRYKSERSKRSTSGGRNRRGNSRSRERSRGRSREGERERSRERTARRGDSSHETRSQNSDGPRQSSSERFTKTDAKSDGQKSSGTNRDDKAKNRTKDKRTSKGKSNSPLAGSTANDIKQRTDSEEIRSDIGGFIDNLGGKGDAKLSGPISGKMDIGLNHIAGNSISSDELKSRTADVKVQRSSNASKTVNGV